MTGGPNIVDPADLDHESNDETTVEELGEGEEASELAKKMESEQIEELYVDPEKAKDSPWFDDSEVEELRKIEKRQKNQNDAASVDEIKDEIREETGMSAENAYYQARQNEKNRNEENPQLQKQKELAANSARRKARKYSGSKGEMYSEMAEEIEAELEEATSSHEELESDSTHEELEESEEPSPTTEELAKAEEAAVEAFDDRGGIWGEIADDIRDSTESTEELESEKGVTEAERQTEVVHSGEGATVVTSHDWVMDELQKWENDNLSIISENEVRMIAEVEDWSRLEKRLT